MKNTIEDFPLTFNIPQLWGQLNLSSIITAQLVYCIELYLYRRAFCKTSNKSTMNQNYMKIRKYNFN